MATAGTCVGDLLVASTGIDVDPAAAAAAAAAAAIAAFVLPFGRPRVGAGCVVLMDGFGGSVWTSKFRPVDSM